MGTVTPYQRRALESIEHAPRFVAARVHRTFRMLVRLGYAEMRLRPSEAPRGHDVGFAITKEGREALKSGVGKE